jgi:putative ABC transport system permease protein
MRFAWAAVRGRPGRAVVLGLGILVAATGFVLLSSGVSTSAARVRSTVGHNIRPAYDILVRPAGSETPLEQSAGLVQQGFLSGTFGGITLAQWHRIEGIPGVSVAAPIAMLGYTFSFSNVHATLPAMPSGVSREIFKLGLVSRADNGLSRYTQPPSFDYVTRNPVSMQGVESASDLPHGHAKVCAYSGGQPTGLPTSPQSAFSPSTLTTLSCESRRRPLVEQSISFPFLLAAIDPVQEQNLLGLSGAVTKGRYLRESDRWTLRGSGGHRPTRSTKFLYRTLPVLAATQPFADDKVTMTTQQLRTSSERVVRVLRGASAYQQLLRAPEKTVLRRKINLDLVYQRLLRRPLAIDNYWASSPGAYRRLGSRQVAAVPQVNPKSVWATDGYLDGYEPVPMDNQDVGFHRLHERDASSLIQAGNVLSFADLSVVGRVNPALIKGFGALSHVPLTTFAAPVATGANAPTTKRLHDRALTPDENIAGYLQPPPLLLTSINAIGPLLNSTNYSGATATAPISAIQIRCGNLHGSIRNQLTRIGQIAAEIHQQTHLQVDVTAGSSPTNVTVSLPAGQFGRPLLLLHEPWTEKGIAVVVLVALDRKSATLLGLVLLVCVFFLANATYAAVRTRRREIGTLRCLGWSAAEVFRSVLGEIAIVCLLAGVVGCALAAALARALNLGLPLWHVLLVPPAALLLGLLAGTGPAWRASGIAPMDALRPVLRRTRRSKSTGGILRLAFGNLARNPGRALLATTSLSLGVAALTVLLGISYAFQGAVTGDLLGDVVAIQVRSVDYLSATLALVLGIAAVVDVLVLNQRERSQELATLRATGWSDGELARLTVAEGMVMAIAGSTIGAALGLGGAASLAAGALGRLAVAATIAGAGSTLAVAAALLVPAWWTRGLSPSQVLAEET